MRQRATATFWRLYSNLPKEAQELADKSFALLSENPRHPSLRLKKVGEGWSARISRDYRAIALEEPEGFTWVWIGPHDEYDRLIKRKR